MVQDKSLIKKRALGDFLSPLFTLPATSKTMGFYFLQFGVLFLFIWAVLVFMVAPNLIMPFGPTFYFSLLPGVAASVIFLSNGVKLIRKPELYNRPLARLLVPGMLFFLTVLGGYVAGRTEEASILSFWFGACGLAVTMYLGYAWRHYSRTAYKLL
ncbi:hypothetical protein Dthio_PD3606 [Desulfonatronospira thiodismutans ASO3-1]|uniref:Uncharacterized protein n=1 Tax=Desulfonatronospira thiodismutans ASO3-1 TaxID=555779 RepID=D6SJU9_9BACT|nr:hypothetical protein [Desulfonatronospira thiodismutans]EFI36152.1 hypothetical protein Dthio_PD3606 [Desulfonatronospira thiodismutans ASO3-1]